MGALDNCILLQILLDHLHRLDHILAMAEGRQPEDPFAAGAETGARRADHVACENGLIIERARSRGDRRNRMENRCKSQLPIPSRQKSQGPPVYLFLH